MKSIFFRGVTICSLLLISSLISVQSKVVVVPSDDGLNVIALPDSEPEQPAGTILFDALTDGKSSGQVRNGAFTDRGWKHQSGEDKIIWDLGQTMEAGIIEFELTGMTRNTRGGYLGQPGSERSYYFGLFNDASGNKALGGTNPAFIEIRYNWGSSYSTAVKFQAGDRGFVGKHVEDFGTKARGDWNENQYYKHKVTFGNGVTQLFIDGQLQRTLSYANRPLGWRYLFLGDINYAGLSGPDNVTYRNVRVIKIR